MTVVAFLGTGQMGAPMAGRLLAAGHDVTVWNRTRSKVEPLRERGATVAATPVAAAASAEVVMTMLADPMALEEVLFGVSGAAGTLGSGALIDMSTVGPDVIRAVANRMPNAVDVLDAPVRGSVEAAAAGSLRIMVGGEEGVFLRWQALLGALGEPTWVGPLGAGAAAKLVNNLAGVSSVAVLAEALALARRLGLEREATLGMLSTSPIASVVQMLGNRIERGDYSPQFKAVLAAKDLRLAIESAASENLDLPVASAARAHFDSAVASGHGGDDWSVVAALDGAIAREGM